MPPADDKVQGHFAALDDIETALGAVEVGAKQLDDATKDLGEARTGLADPRTDGSPPDRFHGSHGPHHAACVRRGSDEGQMTRLYRCDCLRVVCLAVSCALSQPLFNDFCAALARAFSSLHPRPLCTLSPGNRQRGAASAANAMLCQIGAAIASPPRTESQASHAMADDDAVSVADMRHARRLG